MKMFPLQENRTSSKGLPWQGRPEKEKKKWEGKKLYTHIRNIYQEMDEEERDEFLKQAEEMDF